ncbi:MAG: nickel-dependent lactate racemase [Candidatus Helarchaeota archaeon]
MRNVKDILNAYIKSNGIGIMDEKVSDDNYTLILNEKEEINIKIPDNWKVIQELQPKYYRPNRNIPNIIKDSIENPHGTDKLENLLKDKKNIVIISDDQTRPTPVYDIISILIKILNKYGVLNENIKIVVGKGLHTAPNESEIQKKFKDLPNKFDFYIHDPDKNLKLIGTTSSKVPVEINSIVADADFRISLGTIQPHELTGFSGGAAIIVPGVSSRKTTRLNHSLIFKAKSNSYFGNMKDNPIRLDMEEAAKLAKLDLIINTVLDNYGNIFQVFAGDYKEAHKKGAIFFKEHYGIPFKNKADICVITAFPRHKTIGKGLKALFIGDLVTKDNGTIICFISAEKGISASRSFEELLLQNMKVAELLAMLKKGELPGEACVLYLFTKIKEKKIIIITDEKYREKIKQIGLLYAKNFEDATKIIDDGTSKTVYIVPKGINLLPLMDSS